jgi:ABC-type phosphate transport system permease subunit
MSNDYNQASENRIIINYLKDEIKALESRLALLDNKNKEAYVTKSEYEPVRKIVYGIVSLVLVAFMTALIALVIR